MIKPLLDINCIRKPGCEYPMQLRVPMNDGSVQIYNLQVEQPIEHPDFRAAMDALDRMFDCIDRGYGTSRVNRKYRRNR